MTREEFEATFLLQYDILCKYAEKRCPQGGIDLVHQAYTLVVENHTYVRAKPKYAKQWVYFKVTREVSRHYKKERIYHKALMEFKDEVSHTQ